MIEQVWGFYIVCIAVFSIADRLGVFVGIVQPFVSIALLVVLAAIGGAMMRKRI